MRGHAKNTAFFQKSKTEDASIAQKIIRSHTEGSLNLSGKELKAAPIEIFDFTLSPGEKFWEAIPMQKLDLSFNQLSSFPAQLGLLTELISFKFRNNQCSELPAEFYLGCTNLRCLDFAQNKFARIDERIGGLSELRELVGFHNQLTTLPGTLAALSQLQVIDLSNNRLALFPSLDFPCLTHLNVSNNMLTTLPVSLSNYTSLESLECRSNRITLLPPLGKLRSLKRIDAMENKLVELPSLSAGITSVLSFLNVGHNCLTTIPPNSLTGLNALAELHLQDNNLTSLDSSISQCSSLKVLDVSNNSLDDLPYCLGYMLALHRIVASGNKIKSIRQSLLLTQSVQSTEKLKEYLRTRGPDPSEPERGELTVFDAAPTSRYQPTSRKVPVGDLSSFVQHRIRETHQMNCDLSSVGLSSLSACSFVDKLYASPNVIDANSRIGLVCLNLNGNGFDSFPAELRELQSLRVLSLASNKLGSQGDIDAANIPPHVVSLDITKNAVSSEQLGMIISSARRLQVLIAPSNAIRSIPKNLETLTELRELRLSSNQIADLGMDFSKLVALETLDLSNNRIPTINCLATASSSLSSLMLDNNDITNIPSFLGSPRFNFQSLTFFGNPQKNVRLAVMEKGTLAVIELLRNREPM